MKNLFWRTIYNTMIPENLVPSALWFLETFFFKYELVRDYFPGWTNVI